MTHEQIASLERDLTAFLERFRSCFRQERSFMHLERYLVGLLSDVKRKSIEPIALAAGVAVRTLQQFLAEFKWDHEKAQDLLQQWVAQRCAQAEGIAVIDASAHPKRGDKTPGVKPQWCGQTGKVDNCVVGQHLLYTDNDPHNPFSCMLASDLYLPKDWRADAQRCREAWIPEDLPYRPKWRIALDQLGGAIGNGVRFAWATFDEEYGSVPAFWFGLDALGVRGIGEVRPDFHAWATPPLCHSGRAEHASKRVDNLVTHSPVFTGQPWRTMQIKTTTRGPVRWQVKAAQVQLVAGRPTSHRGPSYPTQRQYGLIVARNPATGEVKYFVSNAPASVPLETLLAVGWSRWHVEKWFERAKQEAGLGAFEVRRYPGLIRHWLICRLAMLFLADQTVRLRGEKSTDHPGAGGGGDQHGGLVDLAALAALLAGGAAAMRVPSVA